MSGARGTTTAKRVRICVSNTSFGGRTCPTCIDAPRLVDPMTKRPPRSILGTVAQMSRSPLADIERVGCTLVTRLLHLRGGEPEPLGVSRCRSPSLREPWAATSVVPKPQKGSSTRSPALVKRSITSRASSSLESGRRSVPRRRCGQRRGRPRYRGWARRPVDRRWRFGVGRPVGPGHGSDPPVLHVRERRRDRSRDRHLGPACGGRSGADPCALSGGTIGPRHHPRGDRGRPVRGAAGRRRLRTRRRPGRGLAADKRWCSAHRP